MRQFEPNAAELDAVKALQAWLKRCTADSKNYLEAETAAEAATLALSLVGWAFDVIENGSPYDLDDCTRLHAAQVAWKSRNRNTAEMMARAGELLETRAHDGGFRVGLTGLIDLATDRKRHVDSEIKIKKKAVDAGVIPDDEEIPF